MSNFCIPGGSIYPTLPVMGKDVTQGQFLSRVKQVALPRIRDPKCPTIYLGEEKRWIHALSRI